MFILTVDDEFLISEYLCAILESGGHRVIATFDADEAIEVLEKGSRYPACHYRHQHAGLNGRAPVGGRNQRPMAADPLDRRDRVRAA
jgi:CheY-like chemotaxis protein